MAGDDFVMVQLTAAGTKLADGCPLLINVGRASFRFVPGQPIRVTRAYEWGSILSTKATPDGELLCELVPAAPVAVPSSTLAAPASATPTAAPAVTPAAAPAAASAPAAAKS